MIYNFDEVLDREKYNSTKWSSTLLEGKDIIPLWIADMDFQVPESLKNDITKRLEHQVFGYSAVQPGYFSSIKSWMKKIHNWHIDEKWILYVPGVIAGIGLTIDALTEKGDEIIVQTPVYHRFFSSIESNDRVVVKNPLKNNNGYYTMDYEDLEDKITSRTKMILLCSPHNPVGRVWKKDELEKVFEIAKKHNLYVMCDEVHSDILFNDVEHIPFTEVDKDAKELCVICTAPNKTFNIASFKTANLIVPNEEIRNKILKYEEKYHIEEPTLMGAIALESVYSKGEEWYRQMLSYLEGNVDYVVNYINNEMPKLKVRKPEGTYLLWVDFSSLHMNNNELVAALKDAGVLCSSGIQFGEEGENYLRINVATRRALLEEAMDRIKKFTNKF
ncbi:cystathione beta-lyase [Hathewaya proteolytica DSM 3090]|uniref:cysteine-S-conjugate beta-lyase n=1 Tax=Hathewaya proteolytica DSM 3090 TaxID=1121331 RepID=A0A1M6QBK2_9CLOT|nr:MalY/PatB family protein [Hathewaya proteolytica]SHK17535.1 cystathione beta-lyase [Hathewaya proteolytica DSM 3090]